MALPKLNDNPKYDLIIPSTKNKVRFRPYLVKEEKVLMMASESGDPAAAMHAIVDTIKACISDDVPTDTLTTFDVEYMFTQIRSKSVGEVSRINAECSNCKHSNEIEVPLDQINMDVPKIEDVIKLTDTIKLKMRWPTYTDVLKNDITDKNETEATFSMLIECIDKVMTDEESIVFKDESKEARLDFVESLTADQFALIRGYIEQMPKMKYDLKYTCQKCGTDHELTLEGMKDFL
jgi:hypothetical protein